MPAFHLGKPVHEATIWNTGFITVIIGLQLSNFWDKARGICFISPYELTEDAIFNKGIFHLIFTWRGIFSAQGTVSNLERVWGSTLPQWTERRARTRHTFYWVELRSSGEVFSYWTFQSLLRHSPTLSFGRLTDIFTLCVLRAVFVS